MLMGMSIEIAKLRALVTDWYARAGQKSGPDVTDADLHRIHALNHCAGALESVVMELERAEFTSAVPGERITSQVELERASACISRMLAKGHTNPYASIYLARMTEHIAASLDQAEVLRVERWHRTADAALTGAVQNRPTGASEFAAARADDRHGKLRT
jgi:hypothetical protein